LHPIIWNSGNVTIYSWGLMLSMAVIISALLLVLETKRRNLEPDPFLDLVLIVIFGGILGGRIFYVVFYDLQYYLTYPLEILRFWQGGLVYYGGLIGGVLAGWTYVKIKKISFWPTADLIAPFLALGYAIVRIGCFLNGCCYGERTTLAWGVHFPVIDDFLRHPTQLYLSLMSFIIFGVLYYLLRNKKFDGQIILLYLILYSIGRALIEAFRENLIVLPHITIAQAVSMILFIIGSIIYLKLPRRITVE